MQKIISHRGNFKGTSSIEENNPCKVMDVIHGGYDVEVDVWWGEKGLFLGHDIPKYKIDYCFLVNDRLWIHCKNIEAFVFLILRKINKCFNIHCKNIEAFVYLSQDKKLHLFYHRDGIALTTKGYLWTAPGLLLDKRSIAVMPELVSEWDISRACGVCTDYPEKYKI